MGSSQIIRRPVAPDRESHSQRLISRDGGHVAFNYTDMGNAERLIEQYGHKLRYSSERNTWFIWDNKRWVPDKIGQINYLSKQAVRSMYGEAIKASESDCKELAKHALKSESRRSIEAMAHLARYEPGISIRLNEFDPDPWVLNVENGVLDLKTGEIRDHRREDLMTKLAPVVYDPVAECPTWSSFLFRIFSGNEEEMAFLQSAIGYALSGCTGEQVLFMLHGTGANGKSTLIETIRTMMGDYAQQSEFSTFLKRDHDNGLRNDVARLEGARFVSASESESGRKMAESVVKQLTGGDTITARFLHQEFFEFVPQFKLFLTANHKPIIQGTDEAIWRRIRLIPFAERIPKNERDRDLLWKLRKELPGILNWALAGCLKWQTDGLPASCKVSKATSQYRHEMDVLSGFFEERCLVKPGAMASSKELYDTYCSWHSSHGDGPLLKINPFTRRLSERSEFEPIKLDRNTRGWRRIGTLETQETHRDASSHILSKYSLS